MDKFRKNIIKMWMSRVQEKYGSTTTLSYDTDLFYADNLIFCCIAYEAYAFGRFQKAQMSENRRTLSKTFQISFKELIESNSLKDFEEALNNLKEEIDKKPLDDMTPNSNRPPLDLPDKKDMDRILEIIYRIRSNLLHGGKEVNPSIQRNMTLIVSSFIVLFHIMNLILKQEGLIQ